MGSDTLQILVRTFLTHEKVKFQPKNKKKKIKKLFLSAFLLEKLT